MDRAVSNNKLKKTWTTTHGDGDGVSDANGVSVSPPGKRSTHSRRNASTEERIIRKLPDDWASIKHDWQGKRSVHDTKMGRPAVMYMRVSQCRHRNVGSIHVRPPPPHTHHF